MYLSIVKQMHSTHYEIENVFMKSMEIARKMTNGQSIGCTACSWIVLDHSYTRDEKTFSKRNSEALP